MSDSIRCTKVPFDPLDISTSKKAIPSLLSSSFVNFISGNTWLIYQKKVLTSVRFKIAKVSSTYLDKNFGRCCDIICLSSCCSTISAMRLEIGVPWVHSVDLLALCSFKGEKYAE